MFFVLVFIFSLLTVPCFSTSRFFEPADLRILRNAYPDISFISSYDDSFDDWKIIISKNDDESGKESSILYWADGRMLPQDKIVEKEKYWPVLYEYAHKIPDPAGFSEEHIREIRDFTDSDARRSQAGTPLYLFDAIYDSNSRISVEQHITKVPFLGKYTNVHERIVEPLGRVERRIRGLMVTDPEVRTFVENLSRVDSYNWREIGDRNSRSFHSFGIAVDILPKNWGKKNIYWAWRRDIDPDNWMLLPLERRWMPPDSVIKAFEAEGFIWGGKWIIWDDMHFEYHPELIDYNHIR